jgi:photosystem II stability/assembly factor-like uncharacterized protein
MNTIKKLNILKGLLIILFFSKSNFAQWQQVTVPPEFTSALAVTSMLTIDTTLFVSYYYNMGILRTSDYGTTWAKMNTGLSNMDISTLFSLEGYLYAGSDGGGIYISSDLGQNWQQSNSGLVGWQNGVYSVHCSYIDNKSDIYIGTDKGVFLSTDYGSSWLERNNGFIYVPTSSITAIGNTLFAATNSGVFKSTDQGGNWIIANNGITSDIITSLLVFNDVLFAGTSGGIFRTTDFGNTWNSNNNSLTYPATFVLSLYKIDTTIFAGTWDGVFISSDNGTNWMPFNTGIKNINIASIVNCGKYIYAGADHGEGLFYRPLSELATVSSVKSEEPEIPRKYSLSQNYPNPFNPSTKINYSLPKAGNVKLTIYNSIGRKVATVVDEYNPAGNYSVQFNGSNLASGIYLYRLESENFSVAKKFILMK